MTGTVRSMLRRLSAVAAGLVLATAIAAVAAAPSQAAPPGCTGPFKGYNVLSNQDIFAYHYWDCGDELRGLSVAIQRFVSPNVWTTVESGTGFITYHCNGHALNIYRLNVLPSQEFFNTCG